ncbi:MAG TPA: ATP-binding protein [Geobacteraceae bacterium]|nr:ATP-binding protein [Geobacteraceae bacterium]
MKSLFLAGINIRKTLRFRLLLFFTILSAIITFTFTAYYVVHQKKSSLDRLQHDAKLILSALKTTVRLPLYAEYREGIASCISDVMENKAIVVIKVFNPHNVVLGEGHGMSVAKGGKTITIREDVFIHDYNYTPESLLLGEDPKRTKRIGYIEITMDTSAVTGQMRSLYQAAMAIGFIFWLSTSILGFLLLRHITEPFQKLLEGIKEIEKGNLLPDIPFSPGDETEQAVTAVKDLAASLREREEENRRLNDDLIRSMRLEVREEKKKMMAKLINTNRMTSLGLLVSSMAHEINNPNGSIRLSNEYVSKIWAAALPLLDKTQSREGDFLLLGMPYSEVRSELLTACDNIDRCTTRIEHVIKDLRNYSLGERLNPDTTVQINAVAESAISILRAHGRENEMQILTDFPDDIPAVYGNAKQLEQVLLNMIMNATQASVDRKGKIHVSTMYAADTREVVVEIADEGKGIDPEDMPRLFDPFFSTRIAEGGSGLGLYISKYIIDEHGGTISVESEVGKGSTFRITLPCSPPV